MAARKAPNPSPNLGPQRTVVEHVGPYQITLTYAGEDLIQAVGKGRRYWANLSLQPTLPQGQLTNNYGDSIRWAGGTEVGDAEFGGFETRQSEPVAYSTWVTRMLNLIRAGLLHDSQQQQPS